MSTIFGISAGALALAFGIYFYWKKKFPRFTTFLWLIVGIALAGTAGLILGHGLTVGLSAAGSTSAKWAGIGVGSLIAAAALVLFWEVVFFGMWPIKTKKHKAEPKRYHPPLALLLPFVAAIAGVPVIDSGISMLRTVAGA